MALVTRLVVLALVASPVAAQQGQQAGFWKAKGNHIHNTNAGRVGIGTSSPTTKLDVAGPVAVNGAQVIDGSGMWVGDPTGLVGPQGATGPQGEPGPAAPEPAISTEVGIILAIVIAVILSIVATWLIRRRQ